MFVATYQVPQLTFGAWLRNRVLRCYKSLFVASVPACNRTKPSGSTSDTTALLTAAAAAVQLSPNSQS
jgi:hypothetical protein